jgi:diguanylate cyclase (GGDEF)-like protein
MAGLSARRIAMLIAIPVVLLACAVYATATIERNSALHSGSQEEQAQRLLTGMLDQETGSRGYFETGERRFLEPWYSGQTEFAAALAQSRSLAGADATLTQTIDQQAWRSASWRAAVSDAIDHQRVTGQRPTVAQSVVWKSWMDDFRALNAIFQSQLHSRRNSSLSLATWLAAGVAALVSIVLVLIGIVLLQRSHRQQRQRLARQQELRELLQVSLSEQESQLLLIHHVEQIAPGAEAAVLHRNNSKDRLEACLPDTVDRSPLRALETEQLRPRSCMAVRLSRTYARDPGEHPLVTCEACGKVQGHVLCEPLLVGGEVIGSVLVAKDGALAATDRAHIRDSVVQAAPILANQRNLALAEMRAASDALTALPNRRAADDSIKRMVAHAGRSVTPLSVLLFDLDHFKRVNDLHGHDQGDKVLAAVGQTVATAIRASDFAARYGGEEFLVLLPDTARAGAVEVAEKLRRAIERLELANVGTVTASFGVSSLPEDAAEPEYLVRVADRAMYAAKARGRNRVETMVTAQDEPSRDVRSGGDAGAGGFDG